MTVVWDHYPLGGSEKLTLLALADWCNDRGESLHPSIASIAAKVCVSQRRAQQIMSGFIAGGLLEVIGNATGGAPGMTRQYRLRLDRIRTIAPQTGEAGCIPEQSLTGEADCTPTGEAHCTGETGFTGEAGFARRVQPASQTGEAHCTQSVIEPSKEPSGEEYARSRAYPRPDSVPETVWSDFLKVRRAKKAPVTELAMTGLQREADRAGLTLAQALTVCCEQNWQGFKATWYANLERPRAGQGASDGPYEGKYGETLAGLTGGRMGMKPGFGRPADVMTIDEQPAPAVRLPFGRAR